MTVVTEFLPHGSMAAKAIQPKCLTKNDGDGRVLVLHQPLARERQSRGAPPPALVVGAGSGPLATPRPGRLSLAIQFARFQIRPFTSFGRPSPGPSSSATPSCSAGATRDGIGSASPRGYRDSAPASSSVTMCGTTCRGSHPCSVASGGRSSGTCGPIVPHVPQWRNPWGRGGVMAAPGAP